MNPESQHMHADHQPVAPAPMHGQDGFVQRELNGASFLTLEHVGHMVLVVLVPVLVLAGVFSALSLWLGIPGIAHTLLGSSSASLPDTGLKAVEAILSLSIVAALLVLVPLLVVLDRRTRAEWHKRPGFASRLAYKVPVYSALAALVVLKTAAFIQMLYVVIASLALVGVTDAPIGTMYLDSFLPALAALVIFGASGWYVFKLAKGQDNGKMFSMVMAVVSAALVLALFITSIVGLHSVDQSSTSTPSTSTPSLFEPNSNQ